MRFLDWPGRRTEGRRAIDLIKVYSERSSLAVGICRDRTVTRVRVVDAHSLARGLREHATMPACHLGGLGTHAFVHHHDVACCVNTMFQRYNAFVLCACVCVAQTAESHA